jgi:release factor glutamine methyltransferase
MDEQPPKILASATATIAEPEWTIGALLDWTARFLSRKGSEFPRLDTEVLLAQALGCRRIDLYGERHGQIAPEETRRQFRELVRRRLDGCPVAYLVGRKEFFSLVFEVSPAVLIPRPDTELVVVECLNKARSMSQPRVLDIGTGSGNIAVAVAKQLPAAQVTAVDLSAEALAVAGRNALRHGVENRIRFLQGDLFVPLAAGEEYDFILSNPPYIAQEELERLPPGVRDYEPRLALDGGPGGYAVFERLLAGAAEHLVKGGHLIVEIGSPQEEPARRRITAHPIYDLADTIHDHAGHPRVLRATRRAP